MSVDRIFGLLGRDFDRTIIGSQVAKALKPNDEADFSSHQILIDLATDLSGKIKIVTTNFDRLFDKCFQSPKSFIPPYLPILTRPNDFDGIVHLHGKANSSYDGADDDSFILSSSEFGRAYLSDGWATRFIQQLLKDYILVFVGYSADDPPVPRAGRQDQTRY